MSKILLHICCGPCATATIEKIQKEGYEIVGYYYNPNIHPREEYEKRLAEAKKMADDLNIKLLVPDYTPDKYFRVVKGDEDNKEKRCPKCWNLRLSETAKRAKELGIENIGTTLRISPYQGQEKLLKLGKDIARKYDLKFYEDELTPCFHDSVKISKEKGMYRQKYCGCVFSKDYK